MSKTARLWLLLTGLAWLAYPLTYAPLLRLQCGADHTYVRFSWAFAEGRWAKVGTRQFPDAPKWTVAFLPVRLLATHAPFSYPLRLWAELWEVDTQQDEYNGD